MILYTLGCELNADTADLLGPLYQRVKGLGRDALVRDNSGSARPMAAWSAESVLRSFGAALTPLTLVFVFHLVLAAPDGRVRSRAARLAIVAAYVVLGCLILARALLRDPLLDLYCWRNCSENSFLIHADAGVASALDRLLLWSALAVAFGLVGFGWRRLIRATGPGRRALLPIIGPALLVGASEATYAITLLRTPLEDPDRTGFASIFLARSISYTALVVGLAWTILRIARTRARFDASRQRPGRRAATGDAARHARGRARRSGDRGAVSARFGQLIDAEGRAAEPPARDRAVARIARGERPLALVLHDPALVNEPELARALGSVAKLSVENEALRAEAMAQLHALQASRARIVETADDARRRLERDLHDGAQQRLLALSYDLRLARAGASGDDNTGLASTLDAAAEEIEAALEELRELAHGIYPAILTEAGLGPALATLADEAPLPVELGELRSGRPPPGVERTAYVVVDVAIEDAAGRGATWLAVRVGQDRERLVVATDDDGAPRSAGLVHLADRVGALGGSLVAGDTKLRAEMPCE